MSVPVNPPALKCWHCRQVRATFAASRVLPCCGKTARICTGCRAEIEDASGRTVAAFLDKLAKMHAVVCPVREAKEN